MLLYAACTHNVFLFVLYPEKYWKIYTLDYELNFLMSFGVPIYAASSVL